MGFCVTLTGSVDIHSVMYMIGMSDLSGELMFLCHYCCRLLSTVLSERSRWNVIHSGLGCAVLL